MGVLVTTTPVSVVMGVRLGVTESGSVLVDHGASIWCDCDV